MRQNMNDEERRLITEFVQRVAGANRQSGAWGQSTQSNTAPLPPVDRDADGLIAELFTRHPEARYQVTQAAFVQEHALAESHNRIQHLEYELTQVQQQAQRQSPASGGIFGGLFGGGQSAAPPAMPPPPQAVHAPGYQPGMFGQQQQPGRSGGGFLGTALAAGTGFAGGIVAGSLLNSLLGGHGASAETLRPSEPAVSPASQDADFGGDEEL
jgi:hypothetical protein